MTTSKVRTWERRALGDFAEVVSGYAFKSSEFRDDGVPVIKIKNIRIGFVDLTDIEYVDEKFLKLSNKYHVHSGDVLISLTGSHISQPNSVVGRVARHGCNLPNCLLNQRGGKVIIRDRTVCDAGYLFYALSESATVQAIAQKAHGAANQANVSPSQVESIEVPVPPLSVQQRIGGILSAYDDLIELNTRRIAILEEMAHRLFDEWFIKFRFPGHESVTLKDTRIGLVPEGWQIRPIAETFEVVGGGTPSKAVSQYWVDGDINWYTPTDLTGAGTSFVEASTKKITARGLAESSARRFPPCSVMMTSRATLGVIAINTTEATTNQGFINCIPNKEVPLFFLYHFLKANETEFERHASGATFKEITKGTFKRLPLLLPPRDLTQRFEMTVSPIMHSSRTLQAVNRNLRAARDLLLPKLISAEINLSALERRPGSMPDQAAAE